MEWTLLRTLSDGEREALIAQTHKQTYSRGEILFHEGDEGDTLHLLSVGHVAIRVSTSLGNVATLLVLGPGDSFGELALVTPGAVRNSTVVALDRVETLTLHRDRFAELRRQHAEVDAILVRALADEVRRLSARLSEALYVPVDKRVLRRLVDLAQTYGRGAAGTVIPLTQDDLASMAGTSRPSANKVMRAAEEAGLLRVRRGRIELLEVDGLARHAR